MDSIRIHYGAAVALLLMTFSASTLAHVSEQSIVTLMPADVYTTAGVVAVVATFLLLAVLSARLSGTLYRTLPLIRVKPRPWLRTATSLCSMLFLFILIVLGSIGPTDPLLNPLPLYFWSIWWIGIIVLHGFLGNLWYYINPWSGMLAVTQRLLSDDALIERKPVETASLNRLGMWPAIIVFLIFALFYLAYPAPDDPFRLAMIVLAYWVWTYIAMCWYGELAWSNRGEFITIMTRAYARLAPLGMVEDRVCIGLPGWQIVRSSPRRNISSSTAIFLLLLLGVGSFDGIKETFLWLSVIGVNPLDLPGRSALIWQTTLGLFVANALLLILFAVCVWLGNNLFARNRLRPVSFGFAFRTLAVSLLPIAFAYHLAHYLTTFLVNSQYALAATSDPFGSGADLLGLGQFDVSTGFLNMRESAEKIWLVQALIVVAGHMVSVLIAHSTALKVYASNRRALLSQIPVASFMIAYTYLGLWLLATPKGI